MTEITAETLVDRLRELLKFKYMGDCKCGNCQLVPHDLLKETIREITRLGAVEDDRSRANLKAVGYSDAEAEETLRCLRLRGIGRRLAHVGYGHIATPPASGSPASVPEGWRPIETAPKHTPLILGWADKAYRPVIASTSMVFSSPPTHWQPCPLSPGAAAQPRPSDERVRDLVRAAEWLDRIESQRDHGGDGSDWPQAITAMRAAVSALQSP